MVTRFDSDGRWHFTLLQWNPIEGRYAHRWQLTGHPSKSAALAAQGEAEKIPCGALLPDPLKFPAWEPKR